MEEDKIKKFHEFMSDRKFRNSLSRLVVTGKTKGSLFTRPIDFELHIFYTPGKEKIIDVAYYGIEKNNPRLKINFGLGDHIDLARKWIEDNGHFLLYEINK